MLLILATLAALVFAAAKRLWSRRHAASNDDSTSGAD